jgi:hypothetical protein
MTTQSSQTMLGTLLINITIEIPCTTVSCFHLIIIFATYGIHLCTACSFLQTFSYQTRAEFLTTWSTTVQLHKY